MIVHSHLHVDGKEVAKSVTKHQVRNMGGPSNGAQGLGWDQYVPADAPSLATR